MNLILEYFQQSSFIIEFRPNRFIFYCESLRVVGGGRSAVSNVNAVNAVIDTRNETFNEKCRNLKRLQGKLFPGVDLIEFLKPSETEWLFNQ